GLDATGSALITVSSGNQTFIGNTGDGVRIAGSTNNTVGAADPGLVTVISGNTGNGIHVTSETNGEPPVTTRSDHTTIINSLIGTSSTGSNRLNTLGNQGDGILITDSDHSDVGFTSDGSGDHAAGNVIAGNANGIHL